MSETTPSLVIPEIELADGLSARLMQPKHAEGMFRAIQASPDIRAYITWAASVSSVEDVRSAIEGFQQIGELRYALEDPDFAGYLGATPSLDKEHEYEIGYCTVPEKRRRGYTKMATLGLMSALTERAGAKTFSLYIDDANQPSTAAAASLGFQPTDELRREEKLDSWERRYERAA